MSPVQNVRYVTGSYPGPIPPLPAGLSGKLLILNEIEVVIRSKLVVLLHLWRKTLIGKVLRRFVFQSLLSANTLLA